LTASLAAAARQPRWTNLCRAAARAAARIAGNVRSTPAAGAASRYALASQATGRTPSV